MGYNFEDDYQTFFPFREMLMKLLTPTPPRKKSNSAHLVPSEKMARNRDLLPWESYTNNVGVQNRHV